MFSQNELPFTFGTDLICIKVSKDRDYTTTHKKVLTFNILLHYKTKDKLKKKIVILLILSKIFI